MSKFVNQIYPPHPLTTFPFGASSRQLGLCPAKVEYVIGGIFVIPLLVRACSSYPSLGSYTLCQR